MDITVHQTFERESLRAVCRSPTLTTTTWEIREQEPPSQLHSASRTVRGNNKWMLFLQYCLRWLFTHYREQLQTLVALYCAQIPKLELHFQNFLPCMIPSYSLHHRCINKIWKKEVKEWLCFYLEYQTTSDAPAGHVFCDGSVDSLHGLEGVVCLQQLPLLLDLLEVAAKPRAPSALTRSLPPASLDPRPHWHKHYREIPQLYCRSLPTQSCRL